MSAGNDQKGRCGVTRFCLTYSQSVLVNKADTAAAHADKVVFTVAKAEVSPLAAELMFRTEPGLKPYHPNHRQKVPNIYV
jgi:hypothetical protein